MSGDGSDLLKTWRRNWASCRIMWRSKGTGTPNLILLPPLTQTGSYPPIAPTQREDCNIGRNRLERPRETRREHRPRNPRRGTGNKNPPAEASPPRRRRNSAEPGAPSGRKTAIVSASRMSLKTCACWPVWRRNFSGVRLRLMCGRGLG
jgi:hypothetical protein